MTTASAISRFDLSGPAWVRTDGIKLAASNEDFAEGNLLATLHLAADGQPIPAGRSIATGAARPNELGFSEQNCDDWTSGSGEDLYVGGVATYTRAFFGTQQGGNCAAIRGVFCLQDGSTPR